MRRRAVLSFQQRLEFRWTIPGNGRLDFAFVAAKGKLAITGLFPLEMKSPTAAAHLVQLPDAEQGHFIFINNDADSRSVRSGPTTSPVAIDVVQSIPMLRYCFPVIDFEVLLSILFPPRSQGRFILSLNETCLVFNITASSRISISSFYNF